MAAWRRRSPTGRGSAFAVPALRRLKARGLALAVATLCICAAREASADATAWAFVGGGATGWKQGADSLSVNGALSFDVGAGTSPDNAFIFGGIFRLSPILTEGVDVALLARAATHGFQGGFGLALDAGGYARPWGEGSAGFAGALTLGAPLGLQLGLHVAVGSNDALALGVVAGVDLLRLTVFRQGLLDWWSNPSGGKQTRSATALPPTKAPQPVLSF